ncbi:MAG: hypothetical protein PHE25_02095 [Candidatus Gracilibacteria bacterium]|nr:hypothetical protein [Candidatus Gracilibacteria bacterium]
MKKYIIKLLKNVLLQILSLIIIGGLVVLAALDWSNVPTTVNTETPLTPTLWNNTMNNILNNINSLDTRLDNQTGAYIITKLNQCGGACGSYHAINTRVNVAAYNYTWVTPINTNLNVFSSDNKGTITIKKSGLYLVNETVMMMPNSERAWIAQGCPFINGVANCGINSSGDLVPHSYCPASRRKTERFNLYYQLNAGDTISYGYYIYGGMTYWAHDDYTSMRITRIN